MAPPTKYTCMRVMLTESFAKLRNRRAGGIPTRGDDVLRACCSQASPWRCYRPAARCISRRPLTENGRCCAIADPSQAVMADARTPAALRGAPG